VGGFLDFAWRGGSVRALSSASIMPVPDGAVSTDGRISKGGGESSLSEAFSAGPPLGSTIRFIWHFFRKNIRLT
jgi:hypothetical protein